MTSRLVRLTLALCVLVAITAGCAARRQPTSASPTPAPIGDVPSLTATLPGRAHALTYDQGRNALWYLSETDAGTQLARYAVASGKTWQVMLPTLTDDGAIYRQVGVAPDGSAWVDSGYVLVRVDVAGGTLQSTTLPLQVTGALPNALDPATPLPGTWISAFTFTADSRGIVARNNVPFLTMFSAQLVQQETIALPSGLDGLSAMTLRPGGLYYLPSHASPGHASLAAQLTSVALPAPSDARVLLTDSGSASAKLFVVGSDGLFVRWNSIDGTLEWSAGADGSPHRVTLPSRHEEIAAPAGAVSTQALVYSQVNSAVVDLAGHLWYIQDWDGASQLMTD